MLLFVGFQAIVKAQCPYSVTYTVNTIAELNVKIDLMELNSVDTETTIIVEDGIYTSLTGELNRNITVNNNVSVENACPCTIKAESTQGVYLKGDVAWKLNNSKKLTIDGFIFLRSIYGGVTGIIDFGPTSNMNTIKNSNFSETSASTAPDEVNLYIRMNGGINNTIDNSIFQNKYSKGTYVSITNGALNTTISNSTFRETDPSLFPSLLDEIPISYYAQHRKRYIYAKDSENLLINNCILKNKYSYLTYVHLEAGLNNKIINNIFKEDDDLPNDNDEENGVIKNSKLKAYIKLVNDSLPNISSNTFLRKFSRGHYIDYSPESGHDNLRGLIDDNYFGPKFQLEASSMIKIGSCLLNNSNEISTMNVTVSNNTFEDYNYNLDDYTEIISNKSSGNSYLNNTFKNCSGNLKLRCGNNVVVAGNKFYGNNDVFVFGDETDFNKQGGVFASGKNHEIYNNYFEGLSDYVIQFQGGSPTDYTYERVENTKFSFNTAINCKMNIHFRKDSTIDATEMPRDCKFENNIFSTDGETSTFEFFTAFIFIDGDFTLGTGDENDFLTNSFYSNIYYQNEEHELINNWPQTGINPVSTTIDPKLEYNTLNSMFLLTANSSAIDEAVNPSSYVTHDIFGNNRDTGLYDIGCHEYDNVSRVANNMVDLFENTNTKLQTYPNPVNDAITLIGISDESSYVIYNINGVKVQEGDVSNNQQIKVEKLSRGMYFLTINNSETIKVIKN